MSKKNWFIRIYIRNCISRQHTLRIVSLYYFVFSLIVSGFGAFYMMKWKKTVSQCWYKTQIYGNLFTWNDEVSFSYLQNPSENTLCKRWREEKTVTFKTAQNTISCHKIIIKKKNKENPTKPPNNTFLPYFLSTLFPLFLPLKLCSPVISAEIFNLKWTISVFYKAGGKILKIILSWATFAIRNRLIFSF